LGLRCGQLRVEVRRVDLSENITLFYMGAIVEVPTFEIPGNASVDRRLVPGLDGARKNQTLRRRAYLRTNHRDGRDRLLFRPLLDVGLMGAPLVNSERRNRDCRCNSHEADPPQVLRWPCGLLEMAVI